MKITEIPESVFIRALELMNKTYVYDPEYPDWDAEEEYEYVIGQRRSASGELEKAIYEHMLSEGWS